MIILLNEAGGVMDQVRGDQGVNLLKLRNMFIFKHKA